MISKPRYKWSCLNLTTVNPITCVKLWELIQKAKKLSSIIKLTQQGQTRSPVDIDRWIDDKLEQIERSVHDVTESWNNFVLQYRIDHRLTSLQDKIELLDITNKVETGQTSLIANISRRMDRIRSDLKESISNNFLSTVHEEHDAILNASQGCKDFGKAVATTSTAYLGSMNKRFGQIRDSAYENQLASVKQIQSIKNRWYLPLSLLHNTRNPTYRTTTNKSYLARKILSLKLAQKQIPVPVPV